MIRQSSSTGAPLLGEASSNVAEKVGAKHAIATSSCTAALHLALVVAGVGPGDVALVSDFSFPATSNVVVHTGARPVLVDIDLKTFNMSPEDLAVKAKQYRDRAVAVIPVHAFGCPADMDPIQQIAHDAKLTVIEDAACALGATYKDKYCGTIGMMGCFSFHPRKIITTGEGGMIVTDNGMYATLARQMRSHGGLRREGRYVFEDAGFNYRMSDVVGAIGCAQMTRLEKFAVQRRAAANRYKVLLDDEELVSCPSFPCHRLHAWQAFVVLLARSIDRDAVINAMREREIETTIGTYAFHTQPYARRELGCNFGDCPNSLFAYRHALALPFYPDITPDEIRTVVSALKEVLHEDSSSVSEVRA